MGSHQPHWQIFRDCGRLAGIHDRSRERSRLPQRAADRAGSRGSGGPDTVGAAGVAVGPERSCACVTRAGARGNSRRSGRGVGSNRLAVEPTPLSRRAADFDSRGRVRKRAAALDRCAVGSGIHAGRAWRRDRGIPQSPRLGRQRRRFGAVYHPSCVIHPRPERAGSLGCTPLAGNRGARVARGH